MSEQLWPDVKIALEIMTLAAQGEKPMKAAKTVTLRLRDEYEAKIAELEAQLGQVSK